MNLDEALLRWEQEASRYRRAAETTAAVVEELASGLGLAVATSAREKDANSYRGKVITKKYEDAWAEVTDKAGARAIVATPNDVDRLVAAINSSPLHVVRVEDKRNVARPELLSYSGVHVQVLAPREAGETEKVECEIQIRTGAQDVWSVVSHKLLYKPLVDLPNEDQHAVYRLVALMELFDQEVQRVSDRLQTLPGYEFGDILEAAEAEYQRLAHAVSYRELSLSILSAISCVLPTEHQYPERLRSWIHSNEAMIVDAIATYGPKTNLTAAHKYSMFGQAEFLILLERLSVMPFALEQAWRDAHLPIEWLQAVSTYSDADVSD